MHTLISGHRFIAVLAVLSATPCSLGAFVTTNYVGASGGSWNVALNWSDGLPDDGLFGNTYHAVIGSPVTVNMVATVDLTQLTLAAGSLLVIANDVDPALNGGTITNNGVLQLASAGNSTVLQLNAPDVVFSGSGAFEGLNQNATVVSINAARRLTNSLGHTIRGAMSLGGNNSFLTNNGVIDATDPDGLTIGLGGSSATNFNAGILRASPGSTLSISGSGIDSTGGAIIAAGGTVAMNSTTIVNPLLLSFNGGLLRLVGASSTLIDPIIGSGATLRAVNDNDPILQGTVSNSGTFLVESAGNTTAVQLNSPEVVLAGAGVLEGLNQNSLVFSANAVRRLVNSAGHTIRGSMALGGGNTFLTNDGLIEATDPDGILLDLTGASVSNLNTGTLRAGPGSLLSISGSDLDNTGGTIVADGGIVDVASSTIVNGFFTELGGGLLRLVGGSSSLVDAEIDAGATLHVLNDVDPFLLGTLTNGGTLRLESVGNGTSLQLNSPDVILAGPGVLEGLNQNAVVISAGAVRRLTNSAEHVIRGSMSLGATNTLLTNLGLIEATDPDGMTMQLFGSAASNFNLGTLRAGPGSTLTILNTGLDNAGGVIVADGGTVDINSSTIVDGFFTDLDGGALRMVGGSSSLVDPQVDADATLHVLNDNDPVLLGTVINDGAIRLESVGTATVLQLNSPEVVLSGTGVLEGLNQNAVVNSVGAIRRLTNSADHTVRGSMQLGGTNTLLTNHGLIEATDPDGMTIDLVGSTASNFNFGTLRAAPGATLTLVGTELDNAGGTILADGGTVDINSSTIINGVFDSTGAGALRLVGGSTNLSSISVDDGAHLRVVNDNDPVLFGPITNNGLISWEAAGNSTVMQLNAPVVTFDGDGVLQATNSLNNVVQSTGAVRRLVNGASHSIRGGWTLGAGNTDITNQGLILADTSVGMVIDSSTDFQNQGTLSVAFDGGLVIQPGLFVQSGIFQVAAGRTATRNGGPIDQAAGSTSIDGTLTITGGSPFNLGGGVLSGNGSVNAATVSNNTGTIAPGTGPGQLTLSGSVTFGGGATFEAQVAGPVGSGPNDLLASAGPATLAGTVRVILAGAYSPLSTEEFTVLTASTRTGTFTSVESCQPVEVIYTANSVKVRFPASTGIVGDLNGDGLVNGIDVGLELSFWGPCIDECCPGDFTGDGQVDGADFGILLANWS
jgi:fibronectin-binding autotransporter adhesin